MSTDNDWFFALWKHHGQEFSREIVDAKPWAVMNEEEKYAEWSDFYLRFHDTLTIMPTYVQYCDRFDKEYGSVFR